MRQVASETVGEIDGRTGDTAQTLAQGNARVGSLQRTLAARELGRRQLDVARMVGECERRIAEPPRHPDRVARLRSTALQRSTVWNLADDRYAQRQRSARGVSPD